MTAPDMFIKFVGSSATFQECTLEVELTLTLRYKGELEVKCCLWEMGCKQNLSARLTTCGFQYFCA